MDHTPPEDGVTAPGASVSTGGALLGELEIPFLKLALAVVGVACLLFALTRAYTQWSTGLLTPWWGNALGFVAMVVLGLWFSRNPVSRAWLAIQGVGLVALVVLSVPIAYGMTSTLWWLSLVPFAVTLLSSPVSGLVWTAIVMGLLLVCDQIPVIEGSAGETPLELAMARTMFVAVLVVMALGFRRLVLARTAELERSSTELQRANSAKTRFLANISHELRTPLHGVIAMTDLAMREELPLTAQSHVRTANASANLLFQILSDVLDASRAGDGSLTLDRRPMKLDRVVGDVLRPLFLQATASGLRLEATARPGLPSRRLGDPTRLSQIIVNLTTNALKFTQRGSVVVHLDGEGDELVLTVIDTGRGVPEKDRERIFEPFVQMEQDDTHLLGGTGLGLSIVRDLATLMGGSIAVEHTPGGGATFRVTLQLPVDGTDVMPANLMAPPTAHSLPQFMLPQRPLRVLAAEDDRTNQLVLRTFLQRLGHEVVLVEDGAAAMVELKRNTFDVLLTDLRMPRMSGLELARAIRASSESWSTIPIWVCTAQPEPDDVRAFEELGILGTLGKPFTLEALRNALLSAVLQSEISSTSTGGPSAGDGSDKPL